MIGLEWQIGVTIESHMGRLTKKSFISPGGMRLKVHPSAPGTEYIHLHTYKLKKKEFDEPVSYPCYQRPIFFSLENPNFSREDFTIYLFIYFFVLFEIEIGVLGSTFTVVMYMKKEKKNKIKYKIK